MLVNRFWNESVAPQGASATVNGVATGIVKAVALLINK